IRFRLFFISSKTLNFFNLGVNQISLFVDGHCVGFWISDGDNEAVKVDFDDKLSWEYLFKVYWLCLKEELSLTVDELTVLDCPRRLRSSLPRLRHRQITALRLRQLRFRHHRPFGVILSCKVAEENGQSKGFGFVQFATEQSAVAARLASQGSMVDGKKLFVVKFINRDERAAMSGNQEFTNVYVKNLLESVTEDFLHTMFSQCGTVSSVVVMRDGMGRSRGFGFDNFCHLSMENHMKLFVGRDLRKGERMEMLKQKHKDNFVAKFNVGWFNLYVKNLSEAINETRLREIFGSYGKIVSAKVMRDESGKNKEFNFNLKKKLIKFFFLKDSIFGNTIGDNQF
ncbi:hypothetical protein HID58_075271, partial [Brassica napus]